MAGIKEKSASYGESDALQPASDSRPIPAPGIGRRISDAASRLGSRTSAHSVMGVSSAALQRYIKEENTPPFAAVARLCMQAGVRMEWIATGDGEMCSSSAQTPPHKGSQDARRPDAQMELGLLTAAVRIVGDVLEQFGIRDQVSSDQFGDLVTVTFHDLARGAAEDVARQALDRILSIAQKPHND